MPQSVEDLLVLPEVQERSRRATAALREAIMKLPSTMARLVFVSGYRDFNSGVYRNPTVTRTDGADVDQLLRRIHDEAFSRWLNCCLEEQKADLDLYFSSLECGKVVALRTWRQLESYRWLVPASAKPPERHLFFADIEALLELMTHEMGLPSGRGGEPQERAPREALLTVTDLSRWLSVPARTLRFWAEIGELPGIKVGRQWRFPKEAIREWLRKCAASP